MTSLQEIYNAWLNDYAFREAFKKNPIQALKDAGFDVSASDLAKIESTLKLKNSKTKNEKLDDRSSK